MKNIGFTGENVGGIVQVYEVPRSCVSRLDTDHVTGFITLTLINKGEIIYLYTTPDSAAFEEEQIVSNQGNKYTMKLTGAIPNVCEANNRTIAYLENGYHDFIFADNNGEWRYFRNMRFKRVSAVGKQITDFNCTNFEIYATHSEAALYLQIKATDLV